MEEFEAMEAEEQQRHGHMAHSDLADARSKLVALEEDLREQVGAVEARDNLLHDAHLRHQELEDRLAQGEIPADQPTAAADAMAQLRHRAQEAEAELAALKEQEGTNVAILDQNLHMAKNQLMDIEAQLQMEARRRSRGVLVRCVAYGRAVVCGWAGGAGSARAWCRRPGLALAETLCCSNSCAVVSDPRRQRLQPRAGQTCCGTAAAAIYQVRDTAAGAAASSASAAGAGGGLATAPAAAATAAAAGGEGRRAAVRADGADAP